jgi:hypothetical protein
LFKLRQSLQKPKRLGFSEITVETVIILLRFQIGDIQEDVPKAISGILNSLSRDMSDVARIQRLCSEILGGSPGPDLVATLQEKLWEACKLLRDDTRKSAALFVISNPLGLSGSWWQSKPHFLHAVAAVAGSSKVELVVQCLRLRFSLQPPLTFEELLSEKNLVAAAWESNEIRKLLTPELICEHWKNLFTNSLSITNRSGFPITDVKVTLVYKHNESKDRCCSEYVVRHPGPGETKTWENVFNDPGWFGEKIGKVKTSAACAEQNLKIPRVQSHEKE